MMVRLGQLLASGIPVREVARLLDAESYLVTTRSRSRYAGDIVSFDADRFVSDQLQSGAYLRLPVTASQTSEVILPAGEGTLHVGLGEGIEPKRTIPRTRYLIEVLTELRLDYHLLDGALSDEMVRKQSYKRVYIPSVTRLVFVCNEEGSATFVAHVAETADIEDLSGRSKEELEQLPHVIRLVWTGDPETWKAQLSEFIARDLEQLPAAESVDAWFTISDVAQQVLLTRVWVRNKLHALADQRPEYVVRSGKAWKFHPDLAVQVIELARPVPEDWISFDACWRQLDWPARNTAYARLRAVEQTLGGGHSRVYRYQLLLSPDLFQRLKALSAYERQIRDEWVPMPTMVKRTGKSITWIKKRVEDAQGEGGDYLVTLGSTLYVHPEAAEQITFATSEFLALGDPPEGWLSLGGVQRALDDDSAHVHAQLEKLTTEKVWASDWGTYARWKGEQRILIPTRYYSPSLVAMLKSNRVAQAAQPLGSEYGTTLTALADTSGISRYKLEEYAADYAVGQIGPPARPGIHPVSRQELLFYPPQFVQYAKQRQAERPSSVAPPDWITLSALRARFQLGKKTLKDLADSYIGQRLEPAPTPFLHPVTKREEEFYPPQFVRYVETHQPTRPKAAPDGWVSRQRFWQAHDKHRQWLQRKLDEINAVGQGWCEVYLNSRGNPSRFLHPDCVAYLELLLGLEDNTPESCLDGGLTDLLE
ncbi:hypothetical protein HY375_04085 [Candidatus Berkelbacteria bacterium]|nr:hypothetical protein [Candidatus Berkelbacteria bacterium]